MKRGILPAALLASALSLAAVVAALLLGEADRSPQASHREAGAASIPLSSTAQAAQPAGAQGRQ